MKWLIYAMVALALAAGLVPLAPSAVSGQEAPAVEIWIGTDGSSAAPVEAYLFM